MGDLQTLSSTNAFYYLAKANAADNLMYSKEQKVSKEDAIKQAILQQVGSINDLFSKLALLTFLKKAYANSSDEDLKGFINSLYSQSKNVENQIWQIFYGHFKGSKNSVDGGKDDDGNFIAVLEKLDKNEKRSKWGILNYFWGDAVPVKEQKYQDQINSATKTIESLLKSKNPDNLQALEAAVGKLSDGLTADQKWVKKNDPVSRAANWLQKQVDKNKPDPKASAYTQMQKSQNQEYIGAVEEFIGVFSHQFARRNMWKAVAAVITPLEGALTSEKAAVQLLSISCSEKENTVSLQMQQYKKTDTDYTNFLTNTLKTASKLISDAVIDNN
ncbi:MAG: hypothetical protein KR126chlam6_01445 [Candidatus Anoxychlamydiales bacterium]|nr:hypothetical protein [Candidatus Anoxychlamydiales bacterium]